MSDHALTTMVSNFYTDLNVKCNFKTRVNHQDLPERINNLLQQLTEETMKRYYGSGIVVPENVKGARILDIGCGTGSLVFLLSKLVGPSGHIVGIDVCKGSIDLAKQETDSHVALWGLAKPNFEFHVANAERLLEQGFEPFDLIVSNGVFCLIPDKQKAFQAAAALLKPGGQFYINDVYTNQDLPESAKTNETLWSLGTAGSMIWSTLKETVAKEGFTTPYLTQAAGVNVKNEEYKKQLNNAEYVCAAFRLFKLGSGAARGPATVTYNGGIEDYEEAFTWDINLTFVMLVRTTETIIAGRNKLKVYRSKYMGYTCTDSLIMYTVKGQPVNVDAELASILAFTSFKNNFDIKDYSGSVETQKNQNPFKRLADLAKEGRAPEPIYSVE